MPDSPDRDPDGAQNSMTRGERIRAAARTIRRPRSASWIADETDVSVKTAQKYLEQLIEDNVLLKTQQGDQTLYCVDQLMATYREIARLQREHDRTELTSSLESMSTQITDWKASYGVETPGELRASIADCEDSTEIEDRREAATEWEHLEDRILIVRAALNEYGLATKRDSIRIT